MNLRALVVISILTLLFGAVPKSTMVCLCTGEVGVVGVNETDLCKEHHSPKCSHCGATAKKKGCFAKALKEGPTPVVAVNFSPESPVILPTYFEIPEKLWQPAFSPSQWLSLPRIREPDQSGHPLRAPPISS